MTFLASLVAALSLLSWSSGRIATETAAPATHKVVMEGTRFEPGDLKIKVGDTVVWINKDPFPHTATSMDGVFDSKEIDSGKSWKYTFKTKGQFSYVCTFHPPMKGTLNIE